MSARHDHLNYNFTRVVTDEQRGEVQGDMNEAFKIYSSAPQRVKADDVNVPRLRGYAQNVLRCRVAVREIGPFLVYPERSRQHGSGAHVVYNLENANHCNPGQQKKKTRHPRPENVPGALS